MIARQLMTRQLAAADCIMPIVGCIQKMRAQGLPDSQIAGLFRHAADELDEATMTKAGKLTPPFK